MDLEKIKSEFEAIKPESIPLFLVLNLENRVSDAQYGVIKSSMEKLRRALSERLKVKIPVIILEPGMKLEAVLDPRTKQQ